MKMPVRDRVIALLDVAREDPATRLNDGSPGMDTNTTVRVTLQAIRDAIDESGFEEAGYRDNLELLVDVNRSTALTVQNLRAMLTGAIPSERVDR